MSKIPSYATGQVSALSGLSTMSIYRYVRLFSEFFSPEVQKHTRGRRWLEDAIMVLVSIQSLFNRRTGEDGIREALRKGWRLDTLPVGSPEVLESFSKLWEVVLISQAEAKRDRAAAHELTAKLTNLLKHTRDDHDLLLKLQEGLINQAKEINDLRTRKSSFISFGQHQ